MSEAPAPTAPYIPKVDDRVTIGNNPTPGTITQARTHHRSHVRQFLVRRDGETRTHWVIAEALKPVVEAAAPDPIPALSCDFCEVAPRMEGSNYCADCVSDVVDFFVPQPPIGDEEVIETP